MKTDRFAYVSTFFECCWSPHTWKCVLTTARNDKRTLQQFNVSFSTPNSSPTSYHSWDSVGLMHKASDKIDLGHVSCWCTALSHYPTAQIFPFQCTFSGFDSSQRSSTDILHSLRAFCGRETCLGKQITFYLTQKLRFDLSCVIAVAIKTVFQKHHDGAIEARRIAEGYISILFTAVQRL